MSLYRPERQRPVRIRPAGEREGLFRRRRFVAPHRRKSIWRQLARPFLVALATVGVPLALAFWLLTSPRFFLADLAVGELDRVPAEWVSATLAPLFGQPLLTLPLADVERRLLAHPWVAAVELHKDLPDRLSVEVEERRPAGLLRAEEGLVYVDRAGRVIDRFDPASGPGGLILLSAEGSRPGALARGLRLAAELARLAPAWAEGLSEVEVLSGGDFRLYSAALPFPVLVSAGRLAQAVEGFDRYLPEILSRYPQVAAVDLRFTRQIVVQPAVDPLS